ncbi:zinc finger protein ZAT9-like [Apium graveolens]|uniref:zinc finger protein ZAT9-like n=1 Tax=Apium graveolens TaxID=4045 RepID=UPI003D7ACF56
MMMEKDQELKFLCRFCNKGFVSGNCLGGHMRGHLALISAEKCGENCDAGLGSEEDDLSTEIKVSVFSEIDVEPSYGLRENPKKSWRFSDLDMVHECKKCGREFPSLKSLAVHMRSHFIRRREVETAICKECGKIFGSLKALFGHMRCHPKQSRVSTELSCCEFVSPIRKKRSRTWYSKMAPILSESCCDVSESSAIFGNEIDEVTEAATSLMIMSRGYEGEMVVEDNDLGLEKLNSGKKSKLVDQDFELEGKSCDGYIQSAPDDTEVLKDCGRNGKFRCVTCEKVFHSIQALNGHQRIHRKYGNCTELKLDRCRELTQTSFLSVPVVDSELESKKNLLEKETGVGVRSCDDVKKSNCYECSTCFKVFKSGQALGGHKRAHYSAPNETRVKETMLMNLELQHHIDIPAILKGVPASDVDLKPWWSGNNHELEPQGIIN